MNRNTLTAVATSAAIIGLLIGSWVGLVIALGIVAMGGSDLQVLTQRATLGAVVLLALAAIDTALGADVVNRNYAQDRSLAHAAGTLGAILFLIAVLAVIVESRQGSGDSGTDEPTVDG